MATSKKFSELPAASSVGNGDLFAIAHEDALAETGYVSQKLTAAQAGQKVNGDTEYPTGLPSFPTGSQNPFDALEKLNSDIDSLYPVVTETGSIANFTTSLIKPLVGLSSTIVAQQAGSGTPSPSNPRAISGYDEVVLTHCGVNLWNELTELGNIDNATGEDIWASGVLRIKGYIMVKPNTSYYFKAPTETGKNLTVFFYDENKNFISLAYKQNNTGTTPQNAHYMRFKITSSYGTTYNNDISINYPSTDTSYHAYNANADTFTIALGQTVYGGSVDAKNGNASKTFDIGNLSDLEWSYNDDAGIFYTTTKLTRCAINPTTCKCSCYDFNASANGSNLTNMSAALSDKQMCAYSNSTNAGRIVVKDSSYNDVTAFVNSLSGQQILYPLATPVEITGLTTGNFTTFAGEQNIYADSGVISVSFKQGIQEYIDAKIAETQALIL